MKSKIENIIFDLDGTLYQIDGKDTGYKDSSLEENVVKNARNFIRRTEQCSEIETEEILQLALKDNVGMSKFLSERYNISRKEYFEITWAISPSGIVQNFEIAIQVINKIKSLDLNMILLTAAPTVWQEAVISYLGLDGYFSEIYTADSFSEKGEIFKQLSQRFSPACSISIGDQLETDIKPAKELGFQTLLVNSPDDLLNLLTMIEK